VGHMRGDLIRYRTPPPMRYRPLATQEVGDVDAQSVGDEEKVRELWIPPGVFIPLDAATLHAGEVGQLFL
jgi:hypothetical protein